MLLDLNDPKSIVAWWEVFPERHGPLLAHWAQRRPDVRGAIALASQMIRANPRTATLMREAELRRAASEVIQVPPSHDEQLAQEEGLETGHPYGGIHEVVGVWSEQDRHHQRDHDPDDDSPAARDEREVEEAMAC